MTIAERRHQHLHRCRECCRSCSFRRAAVIDFLPIALRRGQSVLVSAANTDALTGLYNRRRLVADLDAELGRATEADPVLLMLCDLNGFKAYNDTFGHPAGDALLARLGAALAREIGDKGRAYRIGGDEFRPPPADPAATPTRSSPSPPRRSPNTATVSPSPPRRAPILLPTEASSATEAMRAVDLRMYENKNSSRIPADAQTINALLRAIHERDPEWAQRLVSTADLAQRGVPATRHAGSPSRPAFNKPLNCMTSARSASPTRSCASRYA